jgi:hypothetical protein
MCDGANSERCRIEAMNCRAGRGGYQYSRTKLIFSPLQKNLWSLSAMEENLLAFCEVGINSVFIPQAQISLPESHAELIIQQT